MHGHARVRLLTNECARRYIVHACKCAYDSWQCMHAGARRLYEACHERRKSSQVNIAWPMGNGADQPARLCLLTKGLPPSAAGTLCIRGSVPTPSYAAVRLLTKERLCAYMQVRRAYMPLLPLSPAHVLQVKQPPTYTANIHRQHTPPTYTAISTIYHSHLTQHRHTDLHLSHHYHPKCQHCIVVLCYIIHIQPLQRHVYDHIANIGMSPLPPPLPPTAITSLNIVHLLTTLCVQDHIVMHKRCAAPPRDDIRNCPSGVMHDTCLLCILSRIVCFKFLQNSHRYSRKSYSIIWYR